MTGFCSLRENGEKSWGTGLSEDDPVFVLAAESSKLWSLDGSEFITDCAMFPKTASEVSA